MFINLYLKLLGGCSVDVLGVTNIKNLWCFFLNYNLQMTMTTTTRKQGNKEKEENAKKTKLISIQMFEFLLEFNRNEINFAIQFVLTLTAMRYICLLSKPPSPVFRTEKASLPLNPLFP